MCSRHAGLAVLALLVGCRDNAGAPSDPTVPPVLPEPLAEARPLPGIGDDAAVRAFIAALERAAAAGDHGALRELLPASASLDDWLATQGPDRRLRAEVTPHMRVGERRISTVVLSARGGHAPRSTIELLVASGGDPRADGIRMTVDASAPVARVSGDVLIDPRVPWLRADLRFELSAPTHETFSVNLPSSHVRINEITQDGQPCAFTMLHGLLVVAPADRSRPARYRLRYESGVFVHDGKHKADATLLGVFAPAATIDLSVTHPIGTEVFAPFERTRVPTSASDVRITRVLGRGRLAQVRLGPTQRLETATLAVPGGTISLEAPAHYVADVSALLTESATAFAPLGPFPTGALRVTVADVPAPSQYEQGWIVLSITDLENYDGLTNEDSAISKRRQRYEVVAHELAHAWFPGAIPMVFGDNPRWWEAIANYLVTWAAPAPLAHGTRRKWIVNLSEVPIHHERGGYAEDASSDGSHDSTLSYSRAALVLAGLEARVGRDKMERWLRAVVDTRRDQPTDLMALIATVGPVLGQGAEDWTRRWLLAERGASYAIREVDVDGGRFRAGLVVAAPTDENTIQVAFITQDEQSDCSMLLDAHAIVTRGGTAAIDLPIPEDARGLLINANAALPLRPERDSPLGDLSYIDLESGHAIPTWICTDPTP